MIGTLTAAAALVTVGGVFVRSFINRGRQTRTFIILGTISKRIEMNPSGGSVDPVLNISEILNRFDLDRDAWGKEFMVLCSPADQEHHYLVISAGSDGEFESDSMGHYLTMPECDVRKDTKQDLVLRDGIVVTKSGK